MKIVLATGIYPPDIGGPATYCHSLATELVSMGHDVTVVTYGKGVHSPKLTVQSVSKAVPVLRWFLYAKALRNVAKDADIVYAFSSVSAGVPVWLAGLKKPKKLLRLGGDFFWERYTDRGGMLSLREFYAKKTWKLAKVLMSKLLATFDHIVFTTEFQQQIYRRSFESLPSHSVLENALPISADQPLQPHSARTPFRLMFMGRFVPFKNVPALLEAMVKLPDCYLTLVGEGPEDDSLRKQVEVLDLPTRVQFAGPQRGQEKYDAFAAHDCLILPSLTEISPNTALEASAAGLPVLLTEEHGLSDALSESMVEADLSTPGAIVQAVTTLRAAYPDTRKATKRQARTYSEVASETVQLFATL